MSETPPRGPRVFDAPGAPGKAPPAPRAPRAVTDLERVEIEPDEALEREALDALDAAPARRRPRAGGLTFGKVFLTALGAVVSLAIGLTLDSLVRDLFARADWLGWVALAASALLVVGALGVVMREIIGLMRLRAVEAERRAALTAFEKNDEAQAKAAVAGLGGILAGRTEIAAGRARMESLKDEVIDGRDLVALAERELLLPLDAKARALVLGSAKRVSVVTAVSPRALVDLAFVFFETVRLIRKMSELYGARPGTIGLVRLTRDVLAHLAVTGSIAVGDSLVQQVVGHGLAARLSAKLGEGVVNGLLTARIGLAAMDLCRPMPFLTVKRPAIGDFMSDLTGLSGTREPVRPPS
ncbi:YcjF family protein [Aureimonas populi]|uniref:UPF0283 membrane protein ACFSKQ_13945 n=1 Tax=Aureimonas populi TaxID=1701758 RepID=A0ABW5CR54_9HYPH|nr:TIGR01620 family protein [Aureimonas populi]